MFLLPCCNLFCIVERGTPAASESAEACVDGYVQLAGQFGDGICGLEGEGELTNSVRRCRNTRIDNGHACGRTEYRVVTLSGSKTAAIDSSTSDLVRKYRDLHSFGLWR